MNYFDYLQIVTLVIFLAIFIGRSVRLAQKGTQVFRLGSGKRGLAAALEKSFFLFFPLWLFQILICALHLENLQFLPSILTTPLFAHTFLSYAGSAILLLSVVIFALALVAFRTSWRVGIDTDQPGGLVTSGIFSLSRNPIFFSMNLYFLGTFLINGNWFFLISSVIMIFGFHLQIRQEEIFLAEHYGEPYHRYTSQVRRYI